MAQQLPPRRTAHMTALNNLGGDLLQTQQGHTDHRWHRKDDGHDRARLGADPDEHDNRREGQPDAAKGRKKRRCESRPDQGANQRDETSPHVLREHITNRQALRAQQLQDGNDKQATDHERHRHTQP